MLERLPGIFEITLDERPGGSNIIQLFLIQGAERSLLIDAAYGNDYCLTKLLEALESLGIRPEMLDVFITHKHADHCGLAHALQQRGAVIYMNHEEDRHPYDCLYYRSDRANEAHQKQVLTRNGITPENAPLIWAKFMDVNRHLEDQEAIWKMTIQPFDYQDIPDGKLFCYGDYRLEAVHMRGHTYGQMGLVDRQKKLFFAADQILNRTTPIVGTSYPDEQLLRRYLHSVEEIRSRCSGFTILPAHEGPIEALDTAAARIQKAYRKKLDQTLACVLPDRPLTVWDIAKQVYGLTPAKRSDEAFYNAKLITTKTFSMLEYLHEDGLIRRWETDGTFYWQKN